MKQIIPIPTNLNIERFTTATIERMSSYIENGIVEEYPEKKVYVTQRPSFSTALDASATVASASGRGIYYWALANKLYFCNYDTIYTTDYGTACTGSMPAAGSQRVYFAELGDYLICLDPEGNAGYYTTVGAPTAWSAISDAQFPDSTLGTLNHGVAVVDNTLYALNTNSSDQAYVYGSDLLNLSSWTGTNLIAAYKSPDRGVYIGTHHNNVFVMGSESTEFFYDTGNATGSPLAARQDISYNIGCADGNSVFIDNDEVFFVGKSTTSGLGVFKMSNFQIEKISVPSLDSYLTTAITSGGYSVMGSGLFAGGRTFYVLTLYTTTSNVITPAETIVYNTRSNTWTFWEHSDTAISQFPLVQWTTAGDISGTNVYPGKGILSNGDVIECYDDFIPQDRVTGSNYADSGWATPDTYALDLAASGTNITMKVRVGHINFDTHNRKFMSELRPICDETETSQTLSVRYADDNHATFSGDRTIDIGNQNDKLTRLGQFRSRTFEVEYSGSELLRLEGLEVEVSGAGV